MDETAVAAALQLDPGWERSARSAWVALIELCVWGDLDSRRLGAMPRLRRQVLEAGERLRRMTAGRDWIPHPRERLKNALASAIALHESLAELERVVHDVEAGVDRSAFCRQLAVLQTLAAQLSAHERRWAELLDQQYGDTCE